MLMDEVWKDVLGYEGLYQVSNLGRVKGVDRIIECLWNGKMVYKPYKGKIKVQTVNPVTDRLQVSIYKNNKAECANVARLVALAFIPNPDNLPEVDHIDGNRHNNIVTNLKWTDRVGNMNNIITKERLSLSKKGRCYYKKPILQLNLDGVVVKEWDSIKSAAESLGIHYTAITMVLKGKHNTSAGFKWKYA